MGKYAKFFSTALPIAAIGLELFMPQSNPEMEKL